MENVAAVLTVATIMILIIGVIVASKAIPARRRKKDCEEKLAREDMLKIFPQLPLEEFVKAVTNLGWLRQCEFMGGEKFWSITFPSLRFAKPELLGSAFGSILKNWGEITGQDDLDSTVKLLADNLESWGDEELRLFLDAMPRAEMGQRSLSSDLHSAVMEIRNRSFRASEEDARQAKVEAGIRASKRFVH